MTSSRLCSPGRRPILRISTRLDTSAQALEIVAERLGDAGSCDTLQAAGSPRKPGAMASDCPNVRRAEAWARERRVTPSGQQLTPEAVEKARVRVQWMHLPLLLHC